jgi:hypothetical protein
MKVSLTEKVLRQYDDAPAPVQKAFQKQVALLGGNLHHPSPTRQEVRRDE